jgi:RNA polymerase sigma factor (sigma-70 family)
VGNRQEEVRDGGAKRGPQPSPRTGCLPKPIRPDRRRGQLVATVDAERALEKLTPDLRSAFEVVVLDGASMEQAADRLGIPEGTVKSRVLRARRALKEEMQ